MRQIAYPAALGSCVLGAGAAPVRAAEWSITPVYSSSVDYDTNRNLAGTARGSGGTVLTVDLKLKRALEDLQFSLEPRYAFRRFTDSSLGNNGDDRSINAAMSWVGERNSLNLTASYFDQSTLSTEVLETGLVNGDTHRRAAEEDAAWSWNQTERRALTAQFSYLDVSYYGLLERARLLPGYRYPSGSVGEQLLLNERTTFTVSVFGSRLQTDTEGNSSRELGLQAGITYLWSENTKIDASLGKSNRVLTGSSSRGTDASFRLDHSMSAGRLSLAYKRSLVPYGFGFLSEQQQFTAALVYSLNTFWDYNLSFYRTQANETAVLLRLDRHNYNTLSSGLTWHPLETWSVGAQVEGSRTQTADLESKPVKRWRGSVTFTWSALPKSRSW